MNRTLLAIAATLALCGTAAGAPPHEHPVPTATPAPPAAPAPESAPASAASQEEFDRQMAQMEAHMQQMQAQMEQIAKTTDPAQRQKLLEAHWQGMQSTMATMHAMWGPGGVMCPCGAGNGPGGMQGPGMMGGGMGPGRMGPGMGPGMMGPGMMDGGRMAGFYSKLTPEQLKQRQYMSERYQRMQQLMMDHMAWHQHWAEQMHAAPAATPPAKDK